MTFTETRTGDNLIVQVVLEQQTMDFSTKVVGLRGRDLIVDVIYLRKKILNVADKSIQINIMLIRENKVPIIWKNVTCEIIKEDEQYFYQITAHGDGYENNRREAFRLFIGNDGVAQIGINKKSLEVTVKDVSENGFSFITPTNLDMVIGKSVRLVFEDLDITFSLMGIIVRKVKVGENEILYGCKLSVRNNSLLKYINSKQRQTISNNKNPKQPIMGTKASQLSKKKEPKKKQYQDNILEEKKLKQKQYQDNILKEKKHNKKQYKEDILEEKKYNKKQYKDVALEKTNKINKKQYEITSEMKDLFAKTFNQDNV